MANINENLLVQGARGQVGKQIVYRKHGKDTTISRMPVQRADLKPTDEQLQNREQFSDAADYAKSVLSSPDLKKEYGKKAAPGQTAYNVAFRDYLKAPRVKEIDARSYDGKPGSTIVVKAKDDFRVAAVKLSIRTAAGALVETGDAQLDPVKRNRWNYTATQNNATTAGCVISATAVDVPGNTGSLEITL
jgi:hypothetical protein